MSATVRFAPSPTGHIHIGNARTALINWLEAVRTDGTFLLRFDDTDKERSRPEFAEAIETDLRWLGIAPHRTIRQSERLATYDAAAEKLKAAGLVYPCYETPEELERRRRLRRAQGKPPVYDRAALKLTDAERTALEADGRKPHWRFLLPNYDGDPAEIARRDIAWDDLCRGPQSVDIGSLSDPVLIREDGSYLYTLPSIVDDIDCGVTEVLRGDDHITNTAVQLCLFEALGADPPRFGHHNLLTTASGEGLSKRLGSLSVGALRDAGYEPLAIAAHAVLIGTSHAVAPVASLNELAGMFDLKGISRAPARFDPEELKSLNARMLHGLDYEDVTDRLAILGVAGGEDFWEAVRGNLEVFADVADWWQVVDGDIDPVVAEEDRPFMADALDLLPDEPWDETTWKAWTSALKEKTGRKGKQLFMPLRLALTGLDHGPELARLLPFIGRRRTMSRLGGPA
ncbi:glutamyl-tRNA synthetase [Rhodobium orientis]|uniref:Glutamate--tRNA ligase n=1 Tax=Rhodobium orientis TaxID=34017 RepID=A0A327JX73_9HYPH|nr:glutamate--tRNA ligase [Rhodobium orientis]MBB4304034.1 glutamyl-tRNA synthetase [Rhodobium orientis]MBK5950757.1 glutamate--tRNA ligase [Rhodobium orientis]RAI29572.1 glutamate--tRNA ligase [Rhodobium orientis]